MTKYIKPSHSQTLHDDNLGMRTYHPAHRSLIPTGQQLCGARPWSAVRAELAASGRGIGARDSAIVGQAPGVFAMTARSRDN